MRKISIFGLLLFVILSSSSCSSQNTCTIESYYLNSDIFNTDTTYSNVLIDGKSFTIKVLSDKFDEHLEKYDSPEYEFDNISPKTIVIYNNQTGKISYVNKFDSSKPFFIKQSGNLSKVGKLYLHWMSSGGGSGFSSNTSLVFLEDDKIQISETFNSGEMDYVLFNKNDKEIYVLSGIWGDELDENGEPIETHFSEHRYKVLQFRFGYDGFEEKEIGITKNKYPSGDDGISSTELLQLIISGEDFMPGNTVVSEYNVFDNFNGEMLTK